MHNAPTVSFGRYTFHPQQRLVSKAGFPVPLGGRALEILAVLLEAPGQFVSKDSLIARVWPNSVVEENNLRVHIAALRRAFDCQPCIINDPQRGYSFVAPLHSAGPAAEPRHNLAVRLALLRPLPLQPRPVDAELQQASLHHFRHVGRAAVGAAEGDVAGLGAVHVLNRLGFGPRPGDIDRVAGMGVRAYIDQQLDPAALPLPPSLQARLDAIPSINRPACLLAAT